jgi:tripartite-type tricarboxylate transporter receptor subunit TctC
MSAPDTQKALYDAGVEPTPSTPEAMADYMAKDMARWAKVIKDTGIKLE